MTGRKTPTLADWLKDNPPYPWPPDLPDTVFVAGVRALQHLMPRVPDDDGAHWRDAGKRLLQEHMRGNLTLRGRRHYLGPRPEGGLDEKVEDMEPIPRDVFAGDAEFRITDASLSLHARYGLGRRPWTDYYTDIRVERAGLLKAFPLAAAPTADALAEADAPQGGGLSEPVVPVEGPRGGGPKIDRCVCDIAKSILSDPEQAKHIRSGQGRLHDLGVLVTGKLRAAGVVRKLSTVLKALSLAGYGRGFKSDLISDLNSGTSDL